MTKAARKEINRPHYMVVTYISGSQPDIGGRIVEETGLTWDDANWTAKEIQNDYDFECYYSDEFYWVRVEDMDTNRTY